MSNVLPVHVLAVAGSLNEKSATRTIVADTAAAMRNEGCSVDLLDFIHEPLGLFNPDSVYQSESYPALKARVEAADVYLLGTPDYHGSMSSALKNFLEHFWHEFAGKVFVSIVGSNEKGLTVTDQIRTVARQCYAWSLPYGVSFSEREDFHNGEIASDSLKNRLAMVRRDARVYGGIIAEQRRRDLAGTGLGFMARHRPK
jgi:NAD(P)H-dependent FMN reductase